MNIDEVPPSVLLFDEFETEEMIEARHKINLAILQILSAGQPQHDNTTQHQ